jgi:hypothetical protein
MDHGSCIMQSLVACQRVTYHISSRSPSILCNALTSITYSTINIGFGAVGAAVAVVAVVVAAVQLYVCAFGVHPGPTANHAQNRGLWTALRQQSQHGQPSPNSMDSGR